MRNEKNKKIEEKREMMIKKKNMESEENREIRKKE